VFLERQCPELDVPENARWVAGFAPFTPENHLIYKCTPGYELTDGGLDLLCRMDGEWSDKRPNCTGDIDL